jgi:hypothetical protein
MIDKWSVGHVRIVASTGGGECASGTHTTKLLRPSQVPTFKLGRLVTGSSSLWLLSMPWYLEGHAILSAVNWEAWNPCQLGPACRRLCRTLECPPKIDRTTHADQLAVCGRIYSSSRRSGFTATALSIAQEAANIEITKTKLLARRVFMLNHPVDTTQLTTTRVVKC